MAAGKQTAGRGEARVEEQAAPRVGEKALLVLHEEEAEEEEEVVGGVTCAICLTSPSHRHAQWVRRCYRPARSSSKSHRYTSRIIEAATSHLLPRLHRAKESRTVARCASYPTPSFATAATAMNPPSSSC